MEQMFIRNKALLDITSNKYHIGLGYSRSVPNVNQDEDDNGAAPDPGSSTLPKRTSSGRSKLPTYKQALVASRFNYPRTRRSSYSFSEDR